MTFSTLPILALTGKNLTKFDKFVKNPLKATKIDHFSPKTVFFVWTNESFVGTNESFVGTNKSFVGTNESFVGTNKSFVGTNESYVRTYEL